MNLSFDQLFKQFHWREISKCPGRFVLLDDYSECEQAFSEIELQRYLSRFAPDPVLVASLADGGLIVFEKPDGKFVVTLNTESGFQRKLKQLELYSDYELLWPRIAFLKECPLA